MMKKNSPLFLAFLLLSLSVLACALPIPALPAAGAPTQSIGTAPPPFSVEQVGTAVAMTLTAAAPTPGTNVIPATGGSLPHSFYYLGNDSAGLTQVFRIEQDGTTQHQVTSEPVNVNDYDVSPTDGR